CFPFLPPFEEVIRVEIKGKLERVEDLSPRHRSGGPDYLEFAILRFYWGIKADGQEYRLYFPRHDLWDLAENNAGKVVIVKATLTREPSGINRVKVSELKADDSGYVKKTVSVTLRATLHCVITDSWTGKILFNSDKTPEPFNKSWTLRYGVTVNGK